MNYSVIKNLVIIFILAMISSICSVISIFLAYNIWKFILLGSGIMGLAGCSVALHKAINQL